MIPDSNSDRYLSAAWRSQRDPWLCVPALRRVCPFEYLQITDHAVRCPAMLGLNRTPVKTILPRVEPATRIFDANQIMEIRLRGIYRAVKPVDQTDQHPPPGTG